MVENRGLSFGSVVIIICVAGFFVCDSGSNKKSNNQADGKVQITEEQSAQMELDSIAQSYVDNAFYAKNTVYVQFEHGLTLYTTDPATTNKTIQIIDRIMNKIHIKLTRNIHDPFYIYHGESLTIYGLILRTD